MPIKSRLGRNVGLAVIAVPMLIYGASSFDTASPEQTALKVGDRTVSRALVDLAVANAAESYGPEAAEDPEVRRLLNQQVMIDFARRYLALERMDDMGLEVVNGEVVEAVQSDERFQDDGVYSPELFAAEVGDRQDYLRRLRDDLGWRKMDNVFLGSEIVSGRLAEELARFQNEIRIVRVIEKPVDYTLEAQEITEELMRQHYEQNPNAYVEPAKVRYEYVVVDPADFESEVEVDEEALRQAQEERVERARTTEERQLGLIVLGSDQEAREVLGLIGEGAVFEDLAAERSLDAGSKAAGGDIGFLAREDLGPDQADEVFAAGVGDVVGPFEQGGSVLLYKVKGLIGGSVDDFEESRELLVERDRREQIDILVDDLIFDFETVSLDQIDSLAPAAAQTGLELLESEWIDVYSSAEGNPAPFDDQELWSALIEPQFVTEGKNSTMVRREDGVYVAARVVEFEEVNRLSFEEASDEIADFLKLQAALQATVGGINDGIARAREGEVVLELPFAEREAVEIGLLGDLPEGMTEQQRARLFNADTWDADTLPAYTSQFDPERELLYVYRLDEILPGDLDEETQGGLERSQAFVSSSLLKLGYLNELESLYDVIFFEPAADQGAS